MDIIFRPGFMNIVKEGVEPVQIRQGGIGEPDQLRRGILSGGTHGGQQNAGHVQVFVIVSSVRKNFTRYPALVNHSPIDQS